MSSGVRERLPTARDHKPRAALVAVRIVAARRCCGQAGRGKRGTGGARGP